jgi:CheY-like chemotaxis protein
MKKIVMEAADHISEAEDGLDAVNQVRLSMNQNLPFDAILMDYMMPNMNGGEAAKEMRKLGYKGLIIGITGNALPEDRLKYKNEGADEVLLKPLVLEEFLAVLNGMVYIILNYIILTILYNLYDNYIFLL